MNTNLGLNRRAFLRNSGILAGAAFCSESMLGALAPGEPAATPKVSAHLWVYASAHPPNWDGTPDFERAFSDLQFSGFDGVELMAINLRHPDAVEHIGGLSARYKLPITGSSFGAPICGTRRSKTPW